MSIGERILELRKAAGISQVDLAQALEISRQAVSKWENDLSVPDVTNLIFLADLLDTDVEYLTTGRKSYGRRPPVVINTVETVEKIIEKPVIQEKVIEKVVEKPTLEIVEKPVVRKVYRTKLIRNPVEFIVCGCIFFLLGLLAGFFL